MPPPTPLPDESDRRPEPEIFHRPESDDTALPTAYQASGPSISSSDGRGTRQSHRTSSSSWTPCGQMGSGRYPTKPSPNENGTLRKTDPSDPANQRMTPHQAPSRASLATRATAVATARGRQRPSARPDVAVRPKADRPRESHRRAARPRPARVRPAAARPRRRSALTRSRRPAATRRGLRRGPARVSGCLHAGRADPSSVVLASPCPPTGSSSEIFRLPERFVNDSSDRPPRPRLTAIPVGTASQSRGARQAEVGVREATPSVAPTARARNPARIARILAQESPRDHLAAGGGHRRRPSTPRPQTAHPFCSQPVHEPWTTPPHAVDNPAPNVDDPPPSVDDLSTSTNRGNHHI